ncbi:MAG TPA: NADP oxidoreductase, partial [Desulfurobacteriaceae bacterium]|nr:NADP oxidoreductase [Desulfurobacteriaceae bacterium]
MIDFKVIGTPILLKNIKKIDPESIEAYINTGGYEALKKALKMSPDELLDEIKKSELRGRGGAGFPTGIKLEIAKNQKDTPKFVIVNAEEGEPGTFKDRIILENDPHLVIEGAILAAYIIGANYGYIAIRPDYTLAIKRLEKAIEDAYKKGFLGDNILGSDFTFHLKIKKGAGAYICGEETALLEMIEGKRGEPRKKPPYPPQKGLYGKPTA